MQTDHTTNQPTVTKTCTTCKEPKPATTEYYYRDKNRHDGFSYQCKACHCAYHELNRKREIELRRAWRAANRDYAREYHRFWREANREKMRASVRRHMATRRNASGTHTADDVKRQYEAQRGKCYYCKVKVGDAYHVDHVVPLSRGGSNNPENIVIACPACNWSKGDRMPHEWPQGARLL